MAEPIEPRVRVARPEDLPGMLALLQDSGLPMDGVAAHLRDFLVAERDGTLDGMVGLERYGDVALLRSLVVHERARGTGLGAQLVRAVESQAEQGGANALVLLTTTASDWFPRFGYACTTREAVPMSVTASVEFQGACPASAIVMQKTVRAT